uniref:MAM domain-containing protein n=1 Tax=Branchiostoma floridae TaxID=7739 RepID=C3XY64_BRAFL|eukprot:XP_002611108.1 hypothetical protein BRAFLDRAFT_70466 [Branchiostoma floridae]
MIAVTTAPSGMLRDRRMFRWDLPHQEWDRTLQAFERNSELARAKLRSMMTHEEQGHYMYIEASDPRQQGDIARLTFPTYRLYGGSQCLLFWTHMYGLHTGTLRVSVKVGNTTSEIWTRSGNQGNQWFSVAVSISTTGSYQVIFEGVRGSGVRGDIAIDDVSILQEACPEANANTSLSWFDFYDEKELDGHDSDRIAGTLRVSVKVGNTTTEIWSRSGNQGNQWFSVAVSIPVTGSYQVIFEGVIRSGYYSDIAIDDVSILQGACPGPLRVSAKAGNTTTELWSRSGNQGNQWFSVNVSIPVTGRYQVIFEAVIGRRYYGDIAIDDVSILQEACPDIDGCSPNPCVTRAQCTDVIAPGIGFRCTCWTGYVGDGLKSGTGCTGEIPTDVHRTHVSARPPVLTSQPRVQELHVRVGPDMREMVVKMDLDVQGLFVPVGRDMWEMDLKTGLGVQASCADVPAPGTGATCTCPDGYGGNGRRDGTGCTDNDGCSPSPCVAQAICTDVPAPDVGATCNCTDGYVGDGRKNGTGCTDIDGCSPSPCVAQARCIDVPAPGTGARCLFTDGIKGNGSQGGTSSTVDDGGHRTSANHILMPVAGMIGLGAVLALLLVVLVTAVAVNVVLKRRLASVKSKRGANGTTIQNSAFDDTYTDTRTNRPNNDGAYCDVIDDNITKRRGPAYGISQHGVNNTSNVGGGEGIYQTLDPRTLEKGNNEYQKLAKNRVFQQS